MNIRGLLGAPRLTTSECSRQRVQASELARPLAADPRRLAFTINDKSIMAVEKRLPIIYTVMARKQVLSIRQQRIKIKIFVSTFPRIFKK